MDEGAAYVGDSGEEVGNDGGPSEGHLSSWENIAYEGCCYYKEEKYNADISCFFVEVGAVVESSPDVKINTNKEERGPVGMEVADKSSVIYVPTDVCDGREGCVNV